jgi:hypothetical protein
MWQLRDSLQFVQQGGFKIRRFLALFKIWKFCIISSFMNKDRFSFGFLLYDFKLVYFEYT